jgi:phosphatidylserine/phosphatidylglycerophosphate/cardiolipin synthase-like enzyme
MTNLVMKICVICAILSTPIFAQNNRLDKAPKYDVCFNPSKIKCSDFVINYIAKARSKILVQAYNLGHAKIVEALVEAKGRGVDVSVIINKRYNNFRDRINCLLSACIPIYVDFKAVKAHSKIMIIDNRWVITGSYNFSVAGDTNNTENALVIDHRPAALIYTKNWHNRLHHSMGFCDYKQSRPARDWSFYNSYVYKANKGKWLNFWDKNNFERLHNKIYRLGSQHIFNTSERYKNQYKGAVYETIWGYQIIFTPWHQSSIEFVVNKINETKKQIHIQAGKILHPAVMNALKNACTRGCLVEVLLDKSVSAESYFLADFLVYVDYLPYIAHDKIMIFDQETVLTGSHNFDEESAYYRLENMIAIRNKVLAERYVQHWYRRKKFSIHPNEVVFNWDNDRRYCTDGKKHIKKCQKQYGQKCANRSKKKFKNRRKKAPQQDAFKAQ